MADASLEPETVAREVRLPQPDDAGIRKACAWLEALLGHMGLGAPVRALPGNETLTFRIEAAQEPEILIGPKGQTLDALQYLLNAAFMAHLGKRVVLDVGDYREQRMSKLMDTAHDVADRVRLTGRLYKFPPMGSADRRVVHTALMEYADLTTQSEGEDPYRYVVVSPFGRPGRGHPARTPSPGKGTTRRPGPTERRPGRS